MTVTHFAAIYLGVHMLISLGGMFRAPSLAERLGNLRRNLLLTVPPVFLLLGAMVVEGRAPRLSAEARRTGVVEPAWFEALREAENVQVLGFAVLAFAVAMLLVHVSVALSGARGFVTTHTLDLAARDQVELARDRAGS